MSTTETVLLEGITVWDGVRALGPAQIGWDPAAITTLAPGGPDRYPGYALVPGLIDTHVHLDTHALTGAGPGDAWPLVTPPEEKSLHVLAHLQAFARNGVTTVRDLAATPVQMAVGRALDEGVLPGPRLISAGPVGMTAGHGDLFTPPRFRDRPPVADSPDACRALVRHWAREGAGAIKIYTSGGVLSMGDQVSWRNHTRAELEATVDEAHALGLRVAAHSHSAEGIEIALAVGVDSIEHATGMTAAQFAPLVEGNLPIAPTLLINEVLANDPAVRAEARHKAAETIAGRAPVLAAAGAAGVRFVLGTDANGKFVPHDGPLTELRLMRTALGWSSERTLHAATADAADAIGAGERLGRVVVGHHPDLLVVRGRPWVDLDDLVPENIVAVISRGRVLAGALPTPSS